MLCVNCEKEIDAVGARQVRRGLCRRCYLNRSIRRSFKTSNQREPRRRLPSLPTQAAPGSAEKIAVMAARYAAGMAIFHPKDTELWTVPADGYDWLHG